MKKSNENKAVASKSVVATKEVAKAVKATKEVKVKKVSQSDFIISLMNKGNEKAIIAGKLAKRFDKEDTKGWGSTRLNLFLKYYGEFGILDTRINFNESIELTDFRKVECRNIYSYLLTIKEEARAEVRNAIYLALNPDNKERIDFKTYLEKNDIKFDLIKEEVKEVPAKKEEAKKAAPKKEDAKKETPKKETPKKK